MFTIEDTKLLATLIIEIDELEDAIDDISGNMSSNAFLNIKQLDELENIKEIYNLAKKAYYRKLLELEKKAYDNNYNLYS